ncbi:hypothetical protein [Streptacidiphilus cavernicola]|uniref:Uncharacterized protein n=1 Tax=Streptacidiphilus cavernicola TaxID=3342716 RepID=A0ABV6W2N4_9ACTN
MPEARWSRISPAELFPAAAEVSDRGRRHAPGPDEPVYSQLVGEWRQRGRMLPGQRDREWVELVVRPRWR